MIRSIAVIWLLVVIAGCSRASGDLARDYGALPRFSKSGCLPFDEKHAASVKSEWCGTAGQFSREYLYNARVSVEEAYLRLRELEANERPYDPETMASFKLALARRANLLGRVAISKALNATVPILDDQESQYSRLLVLDQALFCIRSSECLSAIGLKDAEATTDMAARYVAEEIFSNDQVSQETKLQLSKVRFLTQELAFILSQHGQFEGSLRMAEHCGTLSQVPSENAAILSCFTPIIESDLASEEHKKNVIRAMFHFVCNPRQALFCAAMHKRYPGYN